MVLLETALSLTVLVVMAVALLGVAKIGVAEMAVVGAARDGALAAARGEDAQQVVARVGARLPSASTSIRMLERFAEVTVISPIAPLPLIGRLSPRHRAMSTALLEPGVR